MKIVHMTIAHDAFDTRIYGKECVSLSHAGFQVVYVVPHTQDEIVNGVVIRSVPIRRSRLLRVLLSSWDVFRAGLHEQANFYHLHDPPLLIVAILLRLIGKRVIYDSHELTPAQIKQKTYIPRWLRHPISLLVNYVELTVPRFFCIGIVGAVPAIAERFPDHKTITVCNFPRQSEIFRNLDCPYEDREVNIVYVGGISEARGIRPLIAALDLIPDDIGVRLKLAGRFQPPSLENEVEQMTGWKKVDFLGWLNREQVNELLNSSKVGVFVANESSPNIQISYPIKIFEYMAAGIPVVCSDIPLWYQLVVDNGAGIMVPSRNINQIAEAIVYLLNHPEEAKEMGERGQQAVMDLYNWETEQYKLINFYRKILGRDEYEETRDPAP